MKTETPLEGARLLPDVTLARVEHAYGGVGLRPQEVDAAAIRGRALVFWDPTTPGKKRDAIDTDQITPAADCVSESLDALDERWKDGAFRFLMPDFRERVARGQTFIVAGDRFAIGSSREMSPAGLKAIGDENGVELVIVCGHHLGDIFRRNALNLGLHVVQAPEAVAEVDDDHLLELDPGTRRLANVTLGKTYAPLPLTPNEEEIRAGGGIVRAGRRVFLESVTTRPRLDWPDPSISRRMTTTEQIVWAHRVDPSAEVRPGATLRVHADLLAASDGTAPFAIHTFHRITGGDTIFPRRAAIVNDHFVYTGRPADLRQAAISQAFARRYELERPYLADPGDGIFHLYFPEQGLIVPGGLYPGADSHSRAYGAYGALGLGVGSTTLGFGWATGSVWLTMARQRRVRFTGRLQPWVTGKDVVLALLRRWGTAQAQEMSVELVDVEGQLSMSCRNSIANMMAEAEALNGLFAQDDVTTRWYASRGIALPYPPLTPGDDARYDLDETLDLSDIAPHVARPHHPSNAHEADAVGAERIRFDKAMIGSCTNGSYEDLLQAALVLRQAGRRGIERKADGVELVVFPGSRRVKHAIEQPEPRLEGRSVAEVLRGFGGQIRDSWCGPCFGQGADALAPGQRAITTFNRNWPNRMGVGGEGYLASPAVVAASALAGYIAPPCELGLDWVPGLFEG